MESGLGEQFGEVRIHTDARAAQLVGGMSARAVTVGMDVAFGSGQYRPGTIVGDAILAHELAHTVQQRGGSRSPVVADSLEGQADAAAESALRGERPPALDRGGLRLQRCDGEKDKSTAPAASATPSAVPTPAPNPLAGEGLKARAIAAGLVTTSTDLKGHTDKLKSALKEVRDGEALGFHQKQTRDVIAAAGGLLGWSEAEKNARLADWSWFLDNGPPSASPRASNTDWTTRRDAFIDRLKSPLDKLSARFPKSLAANWMKNTPANVYQQVIEVATTAVPPALLYAIASREGLVDVYVRSQVPGAATDRLSDAEMATVRTDRPVSGFNALGLDDYFTDREAKRKPLSGFDPAGFDATKLTESRHMNEEGREVRSADAPDLRTALQALAGMIARRQAIFEEDRLALGYKTPTNDEKVYFTYVYYNSGINEGKRTLVGHKPGGADPRTFAVWISKGDYPNAIKALQSYQMIVAAGILKGL
jgi:hypothetical protein